MVHPGRILLESVLRPFEISQNALAGAMGVPARRINEIVLGKRAITADTAIGLEEVIGLPARYWMALQADCDIAIARNGWDVRHPRRKAMRAIEDWSGTY
ncbi:MAG: HigA family addiction module antitoxin [Usitatibacter sp.]